jgi:hypothetical protein
MFSNPFEQQIPINPFQSPFQQGGSPFQQGGSPFQQAGSGWNPFQAGAGFGGSPQMASPLAGYGMSPFATQQAGGISPFGVPPSQFGGPSILSHLAALNPQLIPYIVQQLTQSQRPEALGMGIPQAGGMGNPFASALNYPNQGPDPFTSMLLAQSLAQQGPIRSLTGASPFEGQRGGFGGGMSPMMGQNVDPYMLLLRAQQFAPNPFEQAFRGNPGMSGVGGYGSPFGVGR